LRMLKVASLLVVSVPPTFKIRLPPVVMLPLAVLLICANRLEALRFPETLNVRLPPVPMPPSASFAIVAVTEPAVRLPPIEVNRFAPTGTVVETVFTTPRFRR
jgi:hypothetical protein